MITLYLIGELSLHVILTSLRHVRVKYQCIHSPSPVTLHPHVYDNVTVRRYLSRAMRKPGFCICENKGENQLRDNHAADQQGICFRYIDSVHIALQKSETSSLLSSSMALESGFS